MFKINLIIISLLVFLSVQSVQANVSWSFNSGNCLPDCSGINSGNFGNSQVFGPSTDSVTVSAYSNTADISGPDAFETAALHLYGGGLGISSREDGNFTPPDDANSPHHAMDNNNYQSGNAGSGESDFGDVDAVVFSYAQDIILTGVQIGWKSGDADISVLAHDGIGDSTLGGKTFAQLMLSGWNFIGHFSDLVVGTTKTINTGNVTSSKWLISPYSPEAGNPTSWSFGNDYFKLYKVIGEVTGPSTVPSVPEPSSILLLLTGLIGWRFSNNGYSKNVSGLKRLFA